ncbi:MAG TPA: hypothetical protein VF773_03215 [Verrucomicrobiae bacterium]
MNSAVTWVRKVLWCVLRPVGRRLIKFMPVEDAWSREEDSVSRRRFGSGCVREWSWFFEGESTVAVRSLQEICEWLVGCDYADDEAFFNEPDFWQHPVTFERTRTGDCEDHALWAWRKLAELGYEAELVRGHYFDGRDLRWNAHAAVIFGRQGTRYFMDTVAEDAAEMVMPIARARDIFCPECSVDAKFTTYKYAGGVLILERKLRGRADEEEGKLNV